MRQGGIQGFVSQIKKVEIYRVGIPVEVPFRIAVGEIRQIDTVLVRLVDLDDREGWGEAAPHPQILSSTSATTLAALDTMVPTLLGKDPQRIGEALGGVDSALSGNSAAKAAVDIALHDLAGRGVGLPVWKRLGGEGPTRLETSFSLGIGEPDEVASSAKEKVEAGFRRIKVKVGLDPMHDVDVVCAVRQAIGEEIELTVDANQGWTRQEAVSALRRMEPFAVAYAEQPVAACDIEGMAWVRSQTTIPIMADESVHSPEDALRIAQVGGADYINIKLMKSGGLRNALRIAVIAQAAAIPCMIGAMSESNVAITAAAHLAMAYRIIRFTDLEVGTRESLRLLDHGGVRLDAGNLSLQDPEAHGLGLTEPNAERIGEPIATFEVGGRNTR